MWLCFKLCGIKMSYFINICLICLEHSNNLTDKVNDRYLCYALALEIHVYRRRLYRHLFEIVRNCHRDLLVTLTNLTIIKSQDTNGASIEDKLRDFLPGFELKSNILKYICAECKCNLIRSYEFKQKCVQNITTYEKYAQQVTTKDGSNKYLSVAIGPDSAFINELNYAVNIFKSQTEINVDKVDSQYFIIKEEVDGELVFYDEFQSLLHKIKAEKFESDDICNENEVVEKNVVISANSASFTIGNGNISEQVEKKQYKLSNYKQRTEKDCNKSCKQSSILKQRRLRHTGEKPFTCKICNKLFTRFSNLKQHIFIHTGEKPFKCEVCNKSFTQSGNLKQHSLIHTGEKPFTCKICNKSFGLLSNFKQHIYMHTGKKSFKCEVCNKSFRNAHHLKGHKLMHTGERPYMCVICKKTFRYSQHLKLHDLLHSDIKSYICEVCHKPFRWLSNFNLHKRGHTGGITYNCNVCNESFRSRHFLKRHKAQHTGEKLLI